MVTGSNPVRSTCLFATAPILYTSEESFVADAVRTLLAARPDLREAVACKLYERGDWSIGRAAEWADLNIEEMKRALHRRGIDRSGDESISELDEMARTAIKTAGRNASDNTN